MHNDLDMLRAVGDALDDAIEVIKSGLVGYALGELEELRARIQHHTDTGPQSPMDTPPPPGRRKPTPSPRKAA